MKADLHVHSTHSRRPSVWLLQKIGCPECFTEPRRVYELARRAGLELVTLTDHNTLDGCRELGEQPGFLWGEEVTAYFPEDRCKIHVLVYGLNERQHREIQELRENVYELAEYLTGADLRHALAHPLSAVNDRLTAEHFEKLLLLFKTFELNGDQTTEVNERLRLILARLTPERLAHLADRHDRAPLHPEPWRKLLIGGSDDHSSLTVGQTYTEAPGATDWAGFWQAVEAGESRVEGHSATPQGIARNYYGIAYQFYRAKLGLARHAEKDTLLRFAERVLQSEPPAPGGLFSRLCFRWSHRPPRPESAGGSLAELLRDRALRRIWNDPRLLELVRQGRKPTADLDAVWFDFMREVSNQVLADFSERVLDHFVGGNLFDVFHSVGSAGALYALLAPYFVAFSLAAGERRLSAALLDRLEDPHDEPPASARVAVFTDTFHEVNGAALDLRRQLAQAARTGKDFTVLTCAAEPVPSEPRVRNFAPIGVYDLGSSGGPRLNYPPFLALLDHCHRENYTHIHAATPGPLGLAALAVARLLRLPLLGTYRNDLPRQALHATDDPAAEEALWLYVAWFYGQMDRIYVPSRITADELADRGLDPAKLLLQPRGVDISLFHPRRRAEAGSSLPPGPKLLYVGRLAEEKNLDLLAEAFVHLHDEMPAVSLILVGEGPRRAHLERRLAGRPVHFLGLRRDEELAAIYAACDLFVFPSIIDTFGSAVLEAQAAGLPVLVSERGGPRENMLPGITGETVSGRDPRELALLLTRLLRDELARLQMGQAARRHAEKRAYESAFHDSWQTYRDLRTAPPPPPTPVPIPEAAHF